MALDAPGLDQGGNAPPLPEDVAGILAQFRERGRTDHLPYLVEYGLRMHWRTLKNTGLARDLPVEGDQMLWELVRLADMPQYTNAHEAGWLNSQFYPGEVQPKGWSSYQIHIWAKEHYSSVCDFPNARRIGALMRTIDNSDMNGVGGNGACHYYCQ